jgi:hypothetical protein
MSVFKRQTTDDGSGNPREIKSEKVLIRISLLIIAVCGAILYLFIFQPSWLKFKSTAPAAGSSASSTLNVSSSTIVTSSEACSGCLPRAIDGVMVPPAEASSSLFAVMIDNHPDARPEFGLASSSLVYEAPVEGGLTRYMVVFAADNLPDQIGPIRSARPYFVTWAKELGAVYTHCGGSSDALTMLKGWGAYDLNQFYNGATFWRDQTRLAPHNVITSKDDLEKYAAANAIGPSDLNPWLYKADSPLAAPTTTSINVNYVPAGFKVLWQYQRGDNSYWRNLDGSLQTDVQGQTIKAKNVIVQLMNATVVDSELRLSIQTSGSGRALICLDGACTLGKWKDPVGGRTRYYDNQGNEISFNAGLTWIEVVNDWTEVSY